MNNSAKEKFDQIEKIQNSIDMIIKSLDFWEEKMNICFKEIDCLEKESWHPEFENRIKKVKSKMNQILGKIYIEEEELAKLEEGMNSLYSEIFSEKSEE
tara:strand:+ start:556 stop:852 length:297 start_codon:yes stop_codon:yes gene_type:complete